MNKRILIVDDSPVILAASAHALREAGYVVETRDGIEDLVSQNIGGFDLILIDVQMPQLFGDDVASVLRHQRDVRTPIYLFSTLPPVELQERVREAGIDGFISKSRGLSEIVGEVNKLLA
jgi:DNA-binding response OmpR family regulator